MIALESFKIWFIVATVVGAGIALFALGDAHGLNAKRVAAVVAERDKANARIKGFTQADDQAAIDADVLRDQGYQRALKDLGAVDKCIVTPGMIQAFERIVR